MTKTNRSPGITEADESQLAGAIENLTQVVRVLREAIDEWRSVIRWGLQNGKFQSDREPAVQVPVVDTAKIREAVTEAVEEVGNGLEDILSETLRKEFGDFKDCVDQFSIDVQFAVRKIGEHVAAAERCRQGCLFSDDR